MDAFWQDVRYGMRLLARSPGFTLVTLLVLGLGIGATTTFVSVGDALLLRPLAVREPPTLLRAFSGRYSGTSLIDLIEYGRASRTLQGIAPFAATSMSLRVGQGAPESVFGELVGADYFDLVGVSAARGRTFLPTEGRAIGTSPVIVLSHRGWQRRFGGDPNVIGREVLLNGQPFTIVGIMPEAFTGLYGVLAGDFWVPVAMHPVLFPRSEAFSARGGLYCQAIARMRPGVTIGQVQAELDVIHQRWQRDPAFAERSNLVVYPTRMLVPELWGRVAIFVGLLLGLSAMLLCIACLNVASLQLARSTARAGELGIRLAIGAGRGRLVRQLLTESLVLAMGGGLLGLALAYGLTHAIAQWRPPTPEPVALHVSPDWRVLVGTFAIVVVAAVLVGLAPAWSATRQAVVTSLRQQATRGSGSGRSRLRAAFLVAQVSLSLVLLVVAGLLVRSVGHAQQIDIGFEPDGVLMMRLDLEVRSYTSERGLVLYRDLVQQIGAVPRVRRASLADIIPLTGSVRGGDMLKEGTPPPPQGRTDGLIEHVARNDVGSGYFETMRIPRVLGRDFSERDTPTSPQVAIVNETFARQVWPGESPLGKRVRVHDSRDPNTPLIEVVGVVRDSKYLTVGEEPRPFMYRPIAQEYDAGATIIARVDGDPVAFVPTFREILRRLDPDLPTLEVRAMSEATSISLLPIRVAATFLGALGLVVLALAAIGLYGVLSFLVRLRTKEIGIRMALGADRPSVITTVLRDALRWIAWGVAVGVILALFVTPLAASLLYGVPARDPLTFVGVTLVLIVVGVASCLVPAMRASRVDPLSALRSE
jgi:putative ABC transport system permease protein